MSGINLYSNRLRKYGREPVKVTGSLLEQKIREIEIEADGILNSDKLKTIQRCVTEKKDVYDYILAANDLKEYLTERQKSNVGMAEFKLYWPYSHRVVSNAMVGSIYSEVIELFEDNKWIYYENDLFFIRKYETDWAPYDEEPYLMIKMDRDYLYDLKSMASGIGGGGTLFIYDDQESYFSTSEEERELLAKRSVLPDHDLFYEMRLSDGKYQIVERHFKERLQKEACGCKDNTQLVAFIKEYISENSEKDLSLDVLGAMVHLHPNYLSKMFKEVAGENLSNYITDAKMKRAAELLLHTDLKIQEVMNRLGYQKSQHFSKLFREKYGMSPREYRSEYREYE